MTIDSSIGHQVPLIPQPTPATCWAASTAMLLGSTPQAVISATPNDLIAGSGGLRNYSSQDDWLTGTRKFAFTHGLRFAAPQSWSAEGLHGLLQGGPIVFDLLWRAGQYAAGNGSPGHMVCVTGISSGAAGIELMYNDPWPPNVGAQVTVPYQQWSTNVPTLTYRVFWR